MARRDESRLERAKTALLGADDAFGEGFRSVMDGVTGVEIREPGAPDIKDYPNDAEYREDLHEWAIEQHNQRVDELAETVAQLQAADYPALGLDRREDRERREEIDDLVVQAADQLGDVGESLDWLESIEDDH